MQPKASAQTTWPNDGLESVPFCPLCGGSERALLHDGLKDFFFKCAPGEWSLFECQHCGSAFLDPRPNQQTISLAYSSYYTHRSYDVASGLLRRIWHGLRDDYLLAKFGVCSDFTLWPGRWLLRLFPIGRQGIDAALARNLELLPHSQARLLDVGCGNGNYLEFARRAGWQVQGLDFDPRAVAAARERGLDVFEGTIKHLAAERACYDRITLSHILEHVYDPWELLADCYRLLKPGGVLWLETPNIDSNGQAVFGPYWRGLEPPRHLHIFSRKSLREKLTEVGFSNVRDCFSSFATGAMWRESRLIVAKASGKRCFSHSSLGQFLAEIQALFSPDTREFITLVCVKQNDNK